ncbi:hypothetical protein TWF694_005647 [Orbilia ellipsospora]|uniref:Uncharacterized protein n=1 Tax=Orbilia ellipsospora TaxID=2528407 RepID=A0AAV9WRU9_9PEZI
MALLKNTKRGPPPKESPNVGHNEQGTRTASEAIFNNPRTLLVRSNFYQNECEAWASS